MDLSNIHSESLLGAWHKVGKNMADAAHGIPLPVGKHPLDI